jgi:hypothetical protein
VQTSILQHVNRQLRFSTCALVSKAFAETAAAVPVTTLSTQRTSAAALKSAWQAQVPLFGSQLTHLILHMGCSGLGGACVTGNNRMPLSGLFPYIFNGSNPDKGIRLLPVTACHTNISADQYPIMQLPCPGLRNLGLQNLAVNLAQGAADPADNPAVTLAPLSIVTGLTTLRMQRVVLQGQPQQRLAAMAALTGLQHLHVHNAQHASVLAEADRVPPGGSNPPLLPDGLLPQLQHLTYLHADNDELDRDMGPALSAAGVQDITHLTGLQHLAVSLSPRHATEAFDGPAGISALTQLTYLRLSLVVGGSLPDLALLTLLKHLILSVSGHLHATALTGFTSLQVVGLKCADFDDPAALLSWPQHQSHMTTLHLSREDDSQDIPDLPDALQAAFTGPAAGNKLRRLRLENMLPPSAWQNIFPAGQQCLALTFLEIFSRHGPVSNEPWKRLVAACPHLEELRLCGLHDSQHITDITPPAAEIQPLTALHTLHLSGLQEQHVPHLAPLPNLCFLTLHQTSITDACVTQLTSMQTLERLMVYGENHQHLVWWYKTRGGGGFQPVDA